MNDELMNKFFGFNLAMEKFKDISGINSSTLASLNSVNGILNSSVYNAVNNNPVLNAISGVDFLLKTTYIEPKSFNPMMGAVGNVIEMMKFKDSFQNQNNIADILASSSYSNSTKFLASFTELSSKFDWKNSFPEAFLNIDYGKLYSKELDVFNSNFDKLKKLKIIDEDSTLNESLAVSLNNENIDKSLDSEINQILKISNETFEKIFDSNDDELFNIFYEKLNVFLKNPYTVNILSGIINTILTIYITIYFYKNFINPPQEKDNYLIEEVISVNEIGVKQRAVNNCRNFAIVPIGSEIEVIKTYRVWAKISFINSKGIPQIGYCRIEELKGTN